MPKNIVYCADGTWDTPASHTNVYKLSLMLNRNAGQTVFYDDGVGADGNPISKALGGAFGTGLWDKIKEGYSQIAHSYDPNDPLYLYGFSRGAYTARSLAGMIAICGLPTKDITDNVIDIAFNAYRARVGDDRQELLKQLKSNGMFDAQMTMVGVWDTVGSLGIPAAVGLNDPLLYGFLDTSMHPDIHNGVQALAIDEKRVQFSPTLWTSEPAQGQAIEQVWFCGTHGDVGGGDPNDPNGTALSDITLAWMLSKAIPLGVQIDSSTVVKFRLPLDPALALDDIHNSWKIFWGFFKHRDIDEHAALGNSVSVRVQHNSSYHPPNLKITDGVLASEYQLMPVVSPPPGA